jgi:outer membrane protein assembly factor BamA
VTRVLGAALALLPAAHAAAQAQPPVDLAAPPAGAPVAEPRRAPTVSIVQVTGNRRIEADAVKAVVGTKVGAALSQPRVAEDVRRTTRWASSATCASTFQRLDGSAIVTFGRENPVIRQAEHHRQRGARRTRSGEAHCHGRLHADYPLPLENRRIEAQYQAKGYYLAKVSYQLEPMYEGAVGELEVAEGKKLRL